MTTALAPERHRLSIRRVRFDWADTPVHWVPGDPQTTHTINVLHLLLPEGELWFGRVIRQVIDRIDDPDLLDDVKRFIGQEAVHSRAHRAVLDHLDAQGIDPSRYLGFVDRLFNDLLSDTPRGRTLTGWRARRWLELRVAGIAAIEHFTGVLGDWIIDSPGLDRVGADPEMLDLIRWHGAEEVEHRHVAFELHQHISGSYLIRALAMIITAPAAVWFWVVGMGHLMAKDPTAPGPPTFRGYRRAARAGRLPTLTSIARTVPGYFRPSYDPRAIGSTADALAYLDRSPAARAAAERVVGAASPRSSTRAEADAPSAPITDQEGGPCPD